MTPIFFQFLVLLFCSFKKAKKRLIKKKAKILYVLIYSFCDNIMKYVSNFYHRMMYN